MIVRIQQVVGFTNMKIECMPNMNLKSHMPETELQLHAPRSAPRQTAVDKKMHTYVLFFGEYLNKYVFTANVSTYVKYINTFARQNYLHKIVLLAYSFPPAINGYAEHNYLT